MVAANPFKGGPQLIPDVETISLVPVWVGADCAPEHVDDIETGFCIGFFD
jgi:hypothetical protein